MAKSTTPKIDADEVILKMLLDKIATLELRVATLEASLGGVINMVTVIQ